MSRAGKFIPGGGAGKSGDPSAAGRTAPIRAPVPGTPPETPATPGKKSGLKGSSLVKPVSKKQKLPIMIMSAAVYTGLLFAAIYFIFVLPAQRQAQEMQKQ